MYFTYQWEINQSMNVFLSYLKLQLFCRTIKGCCRSSTFIEEAVFSFHNTHHKRNTPHGNHSYHHLLNVAGKNFSVVGNNYSSSRNSTRHCALPHIGCYGYYVREFASRLGDLEIVRNARRRCRSARSRGEYDWFVRSWTPHLRAEKKCSISVLWEHTQHCVTGDVCEGAD